MKKYDFLPLETFEKLKVDEMQNRSLQFYEQMKNRRTVRDFDTREIPAGVIENCILAAGTAPNGANMQPWHFAVITNKEIKKQIRIEAEKVEKEFYSKRAPDYWLEALEPLGTDHNKPFLEEAPALIVIFSQRYTVEDDESKKRHYYISESTGIATGMLITSIHNAGLVCLTHTPSPMAFLREICNRPKHETPFLVLVVGYPKADSKVPNITKKKLEEIATFL